ncbi:MAG: hypothetical protein LAO30_21775 [Acidobacteriia bacterium]|nr:hypothetical protein [Terriglobia bacterium]
MQDIQRRSFLELVLAAFPVTIFAQTANSASMAKPVRVPAGLDREGKKHAIGVSSTTYKVLTQDTNRALFVMEQRALQ